MAIQQFTKVQGTDDTMNRVQDNIAKAVNPVMANPLLNGNVVTADLLAAAPVAVNHGLGRQPQGWVVVDVTVAATDIYRTSWTNKQLFLQAAADCSVSVLVF